MLLALWLAGVAVAHCWDADSGYAGAAVHDHDDVDFDDYYDEEDLVSTTAMTHEDHTRVRRFGNPAPLARTLSEDEIKEVKGVLKELMSGRNIRALTSTMAAATDTKGLEMILDRVTRSPAFTGLTRSSMALTRAQLKEGETESQNDPTKFYEDIIEEIIDHAKKQGAEGTPTRIIDDGTSKPKWNLFEDTEAGLDDSGDDSEENKTVTNAEVAAGFLREGVTSETATAGTASPETASPETAASEMATALSAGETEDAKISGTGPNLELTAVMSIAATTLQETTASPTTTTIAPTVTTTRRSRRTRKKTTTTTTPTTPKEIIDIDTLVEIIANLTLDYELMNITDLFNKTLLQYKVPKCLAPPETTSSTTSTTTAEPPIPAYDLANASIISKCFVCGLKTPGIPNNAYCADAFAGDFLPLVPVDPKAKGQIAKYRKYCRYLDVPGVLHNETQPRSEFGRWTGGCSVRWIDLSGIYTQRACRNKRRAVMGRHFVSKRMAKLEMALKNEDNGCIISPMSSLVPLSRGISLYARFHACVCTGNWCNAAPERIWYSVAAWAALLLVLWISQ